MSEFVGASEDEILFCGVALGYRNQDAKINELKSKRRPVDEWATFL